MLSLEQYEAGQREGVMGSMVTVMQGGAISSLTASEKEIAVTNLLERATAEIQRAVDMGEPADVMAAYKDQAAAIADLTKRLDLSKDAVLNSQMLQRRAERGLGLAIRAGQEAGNITKRGQGGGPRSEYVQMRNGKQVTISARSTSPSDEDLSARSPSDFATHSELVGRGGTSGIYALTDAGTDDDFERALAHAKEEGNVSRANVVRKIKGIVADKPSPRANDWASIAIKATEYEYLVDAQAALAPDSAAEYFAAVMRKHGVTFKSQRSRDNDIAKSNDLLDRVTLSLEVSAQTVTEINTDYIHAESAAEALDRLTTALPVINKLMRELKKGII